MIAGRILSERKQCKCRFLCSTGGQKRRIFHRIIIRRFLPGNVGEPRALTIMIRCADWCKNLKLLPPRTVRLQENNSAQHLIDARFPMNDFSRSVDDAFSLTCTHPEPFATQRTRLLHPSESYLFIQWHISSSTVAVSRRRVERKLRFLAPRRCNAVAPDGNIVPPPVWFGCGFAAPGAGVSRANVRDLLLHTAAREVHVGSDCCESVEQSNPSATLESLFGKGGECFILCPLCPLSPCFGDRAARTIPYKRSIDPISFYALPAALFSPSRTNDQAGLLEQGVCIASGDGRDASGRALTFADLAPQ